MSKSPGRHRQQEDRGLASPSLPSLTGSALGRVGSIASSTLGRGSVTSERSDELIDVESGRSHRHILLDIPFNLIFMDIKAEF